MNEKNLLKIPVEIKHLFNQDYFDFELAKKIMLNQSPEVKVFFENLMPLVKEFLFNNFPVLKLIIRE